MDTNFTKFNNIILSQIDEFINSPNDLLYVSGFQGCGKSEIVNKALKNIDEDTLLFRHLCFENSVIDDFLLGFYDTLRFYSINKKINLKKSLTENFAQKVSFYFKNLNKKSLIIIDNFELISKNSEIMDFLAHLGKYENVKLILISRILNPEFFNEKGLSTQIIDILPNDYIVFKMKVVGTLEIYEEDDIEELFKQTQGYELYLKMALRYIATVNTTLKEFMEEFKKRKLEFPDFLLSKIVSLVPPIYLPFLQNMACLNHSVNIDFIENYGLGDTSLVNYLYRKMLISKFDNEIYLKDYLKDYFLSSLSLNDKINSYKNLVEIYENELAKSPKNRLLRLSRESIRKQIEFVKSKIPNVPNANIQSISGKFSPSNISQIQYMGQSAAAQPWYMKLAEDAGKKFKDEPAKKDEPLQQKPAKTLPAAFFNSIQGKQEEKVPEKNPEKNILQEARALKETYDYKGAIALLSEALGTLKDENLKQDILIELAENYSKINDFEEALKNYNTAADVSKKSGNLAKFAEIRLKEADLYKKLYRFDRAKSYVNEVITLDTEGFNRSEYAENTAAKGYLELGEIYETENNFKEALKNYQKALSISGADNSDKSLLSEIYFKTALLYDDGQNPKDALSCYKKSIEAAANSDSKRAEAILSTCYANTGLIYAEFWSENSLPEDFNRAVENFESALNIDKKDENKNGIYFASKQLADIFRNADSEKAVQYLFTALEAATDLQDNFKMALSYLEIGDYYYNSQDNKAALVNYLEAQKALGGSITEENKQRISTRLNDMKIKMGEEEFSEVMAQYE